MLFLAAETQWRTGVASGLKGSRVLYFGLDYDAVESASRFARIKVSPGRFSDLKAMEAAALRIMNEHT